MIPKICVIGSYAVGMTMYTERFPVPGETVPGRGFQQFHGGKGSNQAIGASRLGADVTFCSAVGNDRLGQQALAKLQAERLDTTHVGVHDDLPTGVGLVIVDESGENEIVIDFGANRAIREADVEALRPTIASSDLLLLQLEIPTATVEHAIRVAHECATPVILNPAPFQRFDYTLLRYVDVLTPNRTEAAMLLGGAGEMTIEQLAAAVREAYGCNVLLTCGAAGAYLLTDRMATLVPGRTVKSVDTTGAGDAFNAALSCKYAQGVPLDEAARYANIAAGISTTIEGVVPALPRTDQVDAVETGVV